MKSKKKVKRKSKSGAVGKKSVKKKSKKSVKRKSKKEQKNKGKTHVGARKVEGPEISKLKIKAGGSGVRVGKQPMKRVSTGIKNFDSLIEGGFEKNSTNIIVGGSGLGKTIFATQFLIDGMKKGEKCLYVTFEEKKEQFYANMRDFGWKLEEYEKKGLFTFLEYTPIKVKTMLEEGGGVIESIILKNKVTRIVIDSITSFELLFENELSKREAALSLFGMIKGWNCTSLLTIEETIPEGKLASKTLEFEADSIVLLYFARRRGERIRRIEVVKMRGTKHSARVYNFDIGKSGVNVGKSPVSSIQARL